jgi:non-canonical purine NTP pyrophosphatase (RdgB/HAM1 family)
MLTFVSWNKGKAKIAQHFLKDRISFEIADINLDEIQSSNPEDVISHKLSQAFSKIQSPCFVMDTSLYISCFNEFPWPMIKFFFEKVGVDFVSNISVLLKNNKAVQENILWFYNGENSYFFRAKTEWYISSSPKWENGFWWDRIFIPNGSQRTYSEMDFIEKQTFAPNWVIFSQFLDFLSKHKI